MPAAPTTHPVPHIAAGLGTGLSICVLGPALLGPAALALASRELLGRRHAPHPDRGALLLFVVAVLAVKAGLIAQYDALCSAAVLLALAAVLDRRHLAMLAWYGLALGLSPQGLLIAPFFLALLINRRVPWHLWPLAPLAAAAALLPGRAAGWPVLALPQPDCLGAISLNAPNLWAIVQALPLGETSLLGLVLAIAIGASAAYIAWFSATPLSDRTMLSAALLAPLVTAGLLPQMNERCFVIADILAIVFALTLRDRAGWRIAALIQAGSALGLSAASLRLPELAMPGALAMIAATVLLARPLLKPAANDNPLLARFA